jgi:hypothetical protein
MTNKIKAWYQSHFWQLVLVLGGCFGIFALTPHSEVVAATAIISATIVGLAHLWHSSEADREVAFREEAHTRSTILQSGVIMALEKITSIFDKIWMEPAMQDLKGPFPFPPGSDLQGPPLAPASVRLDRLVASLMQPNKLIGGVVLNWPVERQLDLRQRGEARLDMLNRMWAPEQVPTAVLAENVMLYLMEQPELFDTFSSLTPEQRDAVLCMWIKRMDRAGDEEGEEEKEETAPSVAI